MKEYDEIEWFKDGKSLFKTCLPERSDEILRTHIANHFKIKDADRVVIISHGKIRMDSDIHFILKRELGICRYIVYGKKVNYIEKSFWGKMYRTDKNKLCIKEIETGIIYEEEDLFSPDYEFYEKI